MVFTPSHDGISHNPAEHTDAADLDAGGDVLLQVLLRLTEEGLP
jgi:N-carbamoyl-L-amino-acid hydrolase